MKNLIQYIIIASSFLCNYGWSMDTELPLNLDIATSALLEPAILESPALEISTENQYSDMDIFRKECAAHLQQNDAKFVQDKKEILEHELQQSDNEQRSAIIKEQIEIIDGLLEFKHVDTQKDAPSISNKDEKIGESTSLPDSSSPSSFSLVKEMILQDKLIGACFDHLKQDDTEAVKDKRVILMHELSQCNHALHGEKLKLQIQALDTMIQQPDIQKFSQIFHTGEQSSNSSSQPNLAQQTLNRIRQAAQHNRQTTSHKTKPTNALPLSKSQDGKFYIKIDGVKTYVSEGKHLSMSGSDWVVIGNGVFPIGVGQARIDKNGNCHIKDLNGKFHCLANHKWIAWTNGTIYLYQNQQLQMIPNMSSIIIDGKQLINIDGNLCVPQAPSSTFSTTQNADLVSTPAHAASNVSKDVDARIEAAINKLNTMDPKSDSNAFMKATTEILANLKTQGLLEPAKNHNQEVLTIFAKSALRRLNPITQFKDVANLAYHIAKWALLEAGSSMYTTAESLKNAQLSLDRFFETIKAMDPRSLTEDQWAEFLGTVVGDLGFFGGFGTVVHHFANTPVTLESIQARPLDYAHSVIQYEKLKTAYRAQETAQKYQTIFNEIYIEKKLFETSNKVEALEKLKIIEDILPSKIKDIITKITNTNTEIKVFKGHNDFYWVSSVVPGRVPGSKAVYYNKITVDGKTIEVFKDTFDPLGKFIHRKYKTDL